MRIELRISDLPWDKHNSSCRPEVARMHIPNALAFGRWDGAKQLHKAVLSLFYHLIPEYKEKVTVVHK